MLLFSRAVILHGKPAGFNNTASYLSGGEKIWGAVSGLFGAGGGDAPALAARRSVLCLIWVLTIALSAPDRSLHLLALFQAAVAAFYLVVHCEVERVRTRGIPAVDHLRDLPDGDFPQGIGSILSNEGSILDVSSAEQSDRSPKRCLRLACRVAPICACASGARTASDHYRIEGFETSKSRVPDYYRPAGAGI